MFFFLNEKIAFTGDTLFSLGCGKIFEGTYQQMFDSLEKLKNLPKETKIYCGHEYTKKNSDFCLKYNPSNKELINKINEIKIKRSKNIPTVPSTISEEIKCNIFFKYDDIEIKNSLNMKNKNSIEIFSKLRDLKDNF